MNEHVLHSSLPPGSKGYLSLERWLLKIHPDDVERVVSAYDALLARGQPFDLEYRVQSDDGEWRWLRDRSLGRRQGSARVEHAFGDDEAGSGIAARTVATSMETGEMLAWVGGDAELLHEMIGLFLLDVPMHLAEIERAIANADSTALQRAAHTFRGAAGNFGAQATVALLLRLEELGRERRFPEAGRTFVELEVEAGQLKVSLARVRQAVSS
jgi:HPt (histidine-containing phosphotransfer) domain-containing protein